MPLPTIVDFVNPPDRAAEGQDYGTALATWIGTMNTSIASMKAYLAAIQNETPDAIGAIPESLLTAPGDLITATAAGTPTRLGVGTDNQMLTVQSGVPAWTNQPAASKAKVVYFSRDLSSASGTQTITGVGFTPKAIMFDGGFSLNGWYGWFSGMASPGVSTSKAYITNNNSWNINNSFSILAYPTASSSDYQVATVSSWNADGFTLNWIKTGATTGTLYVSALCIG